MKRTLVVIVLTVVNLAIAAFCGFAYFAFTSNMVVETRPSPEYAAVPMAHGGIRGGIYRYVFCAVAGLLLQGVMLIFNLSILQFMERDSQRINKVCLALALAGFGLMLALSSILIGLHA